MKGSYKKGVSYPQDVQQYAGIACALGHPARLLIILLLLKEGELSFARLAEKLPLVPSTVSEHIQDLKNVNILLCRNVQQYVYYSVNREVLGQYSEYLDNLTKTSAPQE